jgi:hypothetical protein
MGFHEDCLVLDGHIDVPTKLWENPKSLTERLPRRHADPDSAANGAPSCSPRIRVLASC